MSSILYYSNYCNNCKPLLQRLSQTTIKDDIHFICIDKRVKKPNGSTNVILGDGEEILLPPNVTKVPALMLLNRGNRVLFGQEINDFIKPQEINNNNVSTMNNGEPNAFSFMDSATGGFGVASDNFSFLDQEPDELSAQGNGGMRQQHHYAALNSQSAIETPPDTYTPNKVGEVSVENLQSKRDREIQ
mgnify:FL=1|tara:strand:+ start:849 stop:1412 length:564 start_codon:yes stop_codon:yes gene_type:complete